MQHLDEGTIHSWLDGALAPNEASAAEAHVQTCEQCARAVAEARGLIAASSRILGALDDVPALQDPAHIPSITARRSSWWRRAGIGYAAAATVLLAAGTTLVVRSVSPDMALERAAATFADTAAVAATSAARVDTSRREAEDTHQVRSSIQPRVTAAVNEGAANRAVTQQAKKEEEQLAVDKVVPLPGAMPRVNAPAVPPPSVRQEDRKAMADVAADKAKAGGVVQGRVLDAATGVPVKGAIVSVDSARQMTQTDSAGKFELQQVPLGRQTVSVRAMGFQAAQHPVAVAPSDSVQLGFALQKANAQLQSVTVTGAAAAREQTAEMQRARRDAALAPVDSMRAKTAAIAGCYMIRVTASDVDADRAQVEAIPGRVQLGVSPIESDTGGARRALTLDGLGRAEAWSLSGDALLLVWRHPSGRSAARFVRSGTRWNGTLVGQTSVALLMEPCTSR